MKYGLVHLSLTIVYTLWSSKWNRIYFCVRTILFVCLAWLRSKRVRSKAEIMKLKWCQVKLITFTYIHTHTLIYSQCKSYCSSHSHRIIAKIIFRENVENHIWWHITNIINRWSSEISPMATQRCVLPFITSTKPLSAFTPFTLTINLNHQIHINPSVKMCVRVFVCVINNAATMFLPFIKHRCKLKSIRPSNRSNGFYFEKV